MQPFPKKNLSSDLSNPQIQNAYVHESRTSKELFQKELDTNKAEQNLLNKRISLMKEFINDLPSSDPHYSMMLRQVQMDQIELDELKVQETLIIQKISETM